MNASEVPSARRTRLLALGAALAWMAPAWLGCQNQCQELCTSWYSYQKSVCGARIDATDLNRCLGDYKSLELGSSEDQACGRYLDFVERLESDDWTFCGELVVDDSAFAFDLTETAEEDGS